MDCPRGTPLLQRRGQEGSSRCQSHSIPAAINMTINVDFLEKPGDVQADGSHLPKRAKLDDGDAKTQQDAHLNSAAFSSRNLLNSLAPSLKLEHDQSLPYRHAVLKHLFDDQLLRQARDEIRTNLSFTLKETDIYKVFQTGDLANLDGLASEEAQKLKHVQAIRDALYSNEFRQFLHQVTSCGPLSGKQTDMSINNYSQGCHLLNHDDVIGTRRVSYILYLTDPDTPWQAADGGSLELYPVDSETRQPLPIPSGKILPSWNHFVFFTVQPGKSFHSVEEVFNLKKSRLSISGWFHLPHQDEPGYLEGLCIKEEEEKELKSLGASLDQLKGKCNDDAIWLETGFEAPIEPASSLTASDMKYLGQFIDPSFLKLQDILRLKDRFVRDSHLSLMGFLSYDFSCRLKEVILVNEAEDLLALAKNLSNSQLYPDQFSGPKFELGLQNDTWELVAPPHKHRYLTPSKRTEASKSSAKLHLLDLQALFQSNAFVKWLHVITTCIPISHNVTPRRFRPGLDYTLATSNEQQLLELHMSLTPSLGWEDGEVGGWDCYMTSSDEDQSDPAVYKAPGKSEDGQEEDDSTLLTIHPSWNKLDLVLRDPQILTFTKYISAKATQSKWDIKAAYKVKEEEED
ncbi:hypothetical protein PCANC_08331 [Puccinia coronata f. sp. avenae]|uniref:uS12 prolyl 3,4-dihydroxylase n=1 Tax=Puccinia coronata f. sp. avenae TaxID=200324 RepID=A0A2N5T4M4_9BASI|nr:hypothetical protein PCASD_22822 [Puccinia coronata f. sp. avenae]PLW20449.1 hypothetical protein PCANC_08331 [Puccinia coronata f. sp. avenae]PLW51227.1 hypothetical protein PCASD_00962 [Puccinia coronata f. sp. avenae]